MTLLIGTDEAGYGPNLGPLLISATAWHVPDEAAECDLYDHLYEVVVKTVSSARQIPIADSKLLYKPGGGLLHLERGLFAAAYACGIPLARWRDAWHGLARADDQHWRSAPWYSDYDIPLPIALDDDQRRADQSLWTDGLSAAGISVAQIRATALFPERFNKLVEHYDSKGAVLSLATLELVRDTLAAEDEQRVVIQCDKHGGRNHYLAVLQTVFPGERLQIVREGRDASVYRWNSPGRQAEIRFVANGESFLPAALASMTAKYLRELAMKAFNAFWRRHLPDLKPTAGYPLDARRFKKEIAAIQRKLLVDDRILWRDR